MLAILAFTAMPGLAAERMIVVMDGSGSMWGQVGGRPKHEIAREALRAVLQSLPSNREVGLMAYGHRLSGNCADIELVVAPEGGTADAVIAAADGLQFLGRTPLTAAVRKAAEALGHEGRNATIVLVTDGVESCNADPCALARDLEERRPDVTVHVVGFGLTAEQGSQVACLAERTGGLYLQAGDAGQLGSALREAVEAGAAAGRQKEQSSPAATPPAGEAAQPAFNLAPTLKLAEDSPPLDGQAGQTWTLHRIEPNGSRGAYISTEYDDWKGKVEPGEYLLTARLGRAEAETRVTVAAGGTAQPAVVLDAGTLKVRPIAAPGQSPDPSAVVRFDYPGGRATGYGETSIVLPAGEQKITVRIGKAEASETLTLRAGETIEKDIVVGVGQASMETYLVEGRKAESASVFVEIFKAGLQPDGTREPVAREYGSGKQHDLTPGDYIAAATVGGAKAEVPFSVKAGERTSVKIVLNAGELTASAPGRTSIAVYEAQMDAAGSRKEVVSEIGDKLSTALAAGNYVVVSQAADFTTKEVPVTVRAGARIEIAVP